jgi:hypothetical protein
VKILTAKDAKCGFGQLIDHTLAGPVALAQHIRRPLVVVMGVEEHERLMPPEMTKAAGLCRRMQPLVDTR